jgi:hydrogenase expression/formation protein HypE
VREPTAFTLANLYSEISQSSSQVLMMRGFPIGKIPARDLQRIVFENLGVFSKSLLVGPGIGEDAAVVRTGGNLIVLSTDPITGTSANIGWLSVHINANDVATRGARPTWYLCSIMLPKNTKEAVLREIMKQTDQACVELGVTVVGGHSEVTPLLVQPIVVGFMIGECKTREYITSAGAAVGDVLILTKSVGIEGTAIVARDHARLLEKHLPIRTLRKAQQLYKSISVVEDAMVAVGVGNVDAMHDPTEGGLLCGVWELGEASHLGMRIYIEQIPISRETDVVCRSLKIDPLRIMSSGSLLIAAKPFSAKKIISRLSRRGIAATEIGEFTEYDQGRTVINRDGSRTELSPPFREEVYEVNERLESSNE